MAVGRSCRYTIGARRSRPGRTASRVRGSRARGRLVGPTTSRDCRPSRASSRRQPDLHHMFRARPPGGRTRRCRDGPHGIPGVLVWPARRGVAADRAPSSSWLERIAWSVRLSLVANRGSSARRGDPRLDERRERRSFPAQSPKAGRGPRRRKAYRRWRLPRNRGDQTGGRCGRWVLEDGHLAVPSRRCPHICPRPSAPARGGERIPTRAKRPAVIGPSEVPPWVGGAPGWPVSSQPTIALHHHVVGRTFRVGPLCRIRSPAATPPRPAASAPPSRSPTAPRDRAGVPTTTSARPSNSSNRTRSAGRQVERHRRLAPVQGSK